MAASKQASIYTHVRNAVTLVWGSLRLTQIIRSYMDTENLSLLLIYLNTFVWFWSFSTLMLVLIARTKFGDFSDQRHYR